MMLYSCWSICPQVKIGQHPSSALQPINLLSDCVSCVTVKLAPNDATCALLRCLCAVQMGLNGIFTGAAATAAAAAACQQGASWPEAAASSPAACSQWRCTHAGPVLVRRVFPGADDDA